jgi:photosystem II stability/assembly factor-like uncharacterized protein
MYYTSDGGDTWNARDAGNYSAIDFLNELFGMAVGGAANGLVYVTIDGGFDWQPLDLVANAGLTNVEVVTTQLAYVTGNAYGGTGFIAKVMPK